MNRMQKTTVCLVFLDSCGCGPTPRIHLRAEHPGERSMAIETPPVKRDLVAITIVGLPAMQDGQRKGPPLSGTRQMWLAPFDSTARTSFYKTHFHRYWTGVR